MKLGRTARVNLNQGLNSVFCGKNLDSRSAVKSQLRTSTEPNWEGKVGKGRDRIIENNLKNNC